MYLNLCPQELAGINTKQNRHQLEIIVSDIHKYLDLTTSSGGELLGQLVEDQNSLSAAVYDPDKNSLIFRQLS